jgi:general secretion pathway protein K
MTRRGFALLKVLWLIVALTTVAWAAVAVARRGADATRNRIRLTEAAWARNACEEILLARAAARGRAVPVDSVALGGTAWCRAWIEEADTRVDLNLASPETLRALMGSDSLADALLDWRDADDVSRASGAEQGWYRARGRREPRNGPLADLKELRLVRGFDSALVQRLASVLTTRGTGHVDLSAAPAEVLRTLPGLDGAGVEVILRRRDGQGLRTTDELLPLLSAPGRAGLLGRYQEFTAQAVYSPTRVVIRVEGRAGSPPLVSSARLLAVPAPDRLAILRREVQ